MSLTADDKAIVKDFWAKASSRAEEVGSEALFRMLAVYPQTKTYYSHWDMSPGSAQVKKHGKIIMAGFGEAVDKIDDLTERNTFNLRVEPANYKILSQILLVVLARTFPKEFTTEVHVSIDRFLSHVSYPLSEKPQTEASAVTVQ